MFYAENFFDLDSFTHRSLWKEGEPIWSLFSQLNDYLNQYSYHIEIEIPKGVHLENASFIAIGEGTVLEPGTFIKGPCIIGKHCSLRHGSYVREGTILGDESIVGHSVELKRSVLLPRASISHLSYVGDSIIGSRVNLGAGVKCANVRLDKKEISIGGVFTGLKKLGAILGDDVQVGCNAVLNPGTLVGKESAIYPLLNVGGVIAAQSRVSGSPLWNVEPIPEKILQRLLH